MVSLVNGGRVINSKVTMGGIAPGLFFPLRFTTHTGAWFDEKRDMKPCQIAATTVHPPAARDHLNKRSEALFMNLI